MSTFANNALLGGGVRFGLENKESSNEDQKYLVTKPLMANLDITVKYLQISTEVVRYRRVPLSRTATHTKMHVPSLFVQ